MAAILSLVSQIKVNKKLSPRNKEIKKCDLNLAEYLRADRIHQALL